jgi:hypothetical protein
MGVPQDEAIRGAYAQMLEAADTAFRAVDDELTTARTDGDADPARVRMLEAQLVRTTELIDLLESAVAQAVDNLARPTPDAIARR